VNQELVTLLRSSVALWIIGLSSIAAIAVAVERAVALWRFGERARSLADAVARAVLRGDLDDARAQCERSGSPAADVFLAGLVAAARRPPAPDKVAAAVERQRQQLQLQLRARLWVLATVGATAPFVGLFGTVVGIMAAFRNMAATGAGGFAVVAAGISEALVTTAAGIAVAVEAVVLYNYFNTHVQRLGLQFRLLAEEFLEVLRDAPAGAATQPGPPPPPARGQEVA
jgi:biopolymer transport protein ExbB